MAGMLTVALRNRIRKASGVELEFALRNIRVNADVRGCSGFVKNTVTGKIVYVNTEPSPYGPLSDKVLYRTAEHFKDYTGGRNQWGLVDGDEFIHDIVKELARV